MKYLNEEASQLLESLDVYLGIQVDIDDIDFVDDLVDINLSRNYDSGFGGGIRDYYISVKTPEEGRMIVDRAKRIFGNKLINHAFIDD